MSISDLTILIDGVPRRVPAGSTVAVALLQSGMLDFRHDLAGRPRGPLCAMGSCFECRVTVDGVAEVRACLAVVRDGMTVERTR